MRGRNEEAKTGGRGRCHGLHWSEGRYLPQGCTGQRPESGWGGWRWNRMVP